MFMVIIFVLGVAWLGREKRPVRAGTRVGQAKPVQEKPYKLTKADKISVAVKVLEDMANEGASYEEQILYLRMAGLTKADEKAIFDYMDRETE